MVDETDWEYGDDISSESQESEPYFWGDEQVPSDISFEKNKFLHFRRNKYPLFAPGHKKTQDIDVEFY